MNYDVTKFPLNQTCALCYPWLAKQSAYEKIFYTADSGDSSFFVIPAISDFSFQTNELFLLLRTIFLKNETLSKESKEANYCNYIRRTSEESA